MDAKKLTPGKKGTSGMIPLKDPDLNSIEGLNAALNVIIDFAANMNLRGAVAPSSPLRYAVENLRDQGRTKEYTKFISERWGIPTDKIIEAIICIKAYVLFPLLSDQYGMYRQAKKVKKELANIHKLIADIEARAIEKPPEITIRATKRGQSKDVHIKSEMIVGSLFECLKTLPKTELKAPTRGRPEGETFEIRQMKYCANAIKEQFTPFIEGSNNNLYECIGNVFIAAGIYKGESDFNKQRPIPQSSFQENLISKLKALLKG